MFEFLNKLALVSTTLALLPLSYGAQIPVTVGGPGILKYDPEFVTANPGDTIVFTFKQSNHTVTQSTLQNPCQALNEGFDSGFIPVSDNNTAGPFPQAQFTVQDTNPVFAYCRQANHCQQGMVFAINPGDSFAAFQSSAMGNSSSSSASPPSVSSATAPPPVSSSPPPTAASPSVVTVTATVTVNGTPQVTVYGSYPGSAAPTAAMSTDHKIIVGGPSKLIFDPANITAQVGDTITFQFMQKNHTATQSSFANPCLSLTQTSTSGQVGFDSGFMPVADTATTFPSFTIQINDTSPIWAFCKQTNPINHCSQGMVFAANAVESGLNNFEAFLARAKLPTASASATSASVSASASSRVNSALDVRVGRGAGLTALFGVVLGLWF